jgi:hypothetical protein
VTERNRPADFGGPVCAVMFIKCHGEDLDSGSCKVDFDVGRFCRSTITMAASSPATFANASLRQADAPRRNNGPPSDETQPVLALDYFPSNEPLENMAK